MQILRDKVKADKKLIVARKHGLDRLGGKEFLACV